MKLCLIACRVLWRELCRFAADSPHDIHFRFLPQGLHLDPARLRRELQTALDQAEAEGFDRILVGYGLCCLGTCGVKTQKTPWIIARAHDCITFLLGSKERYQTYFTRHPATYWFSPGWIETGTQPSAKRLEQSYAYYRERFGEDNAGYLMEKLEGWVKDYRRAAYVDLGVGDREKYLAYTRRCVAELGWELEVLSGDPRLLTSFLNGPWEESEFLVVPPGRIIRPSGNEGIIIISEETDQKEETSHAIQKDAGAGGVRVAAGSERLPGPDEGL